MENEVKTGRIEQVNIDEQMRSSYIDYSMSVIVSRALPDVRDGFKPVHRRVLFGMDGLGLRHTSQTKKSARIVGEVLGKYLQKLLSLIRSHLFTFIFISFTLRGGSQRILFLFMSQCSLCFPLRVL